MYNNQQGKFLQLILMKKEESAYVIIATRNGISNFKANVQYFKCYMVVKNQWILLLTLIIWCWKRLELYNPNQC